jgi:hypothetical protein
MPNLGCKEYHHRLQTANYMHLIILRTSGSAAEDEAEGLQVGQKTSHLATRLPGTEIMKSQFKLDYLDSLISLISLISLAV